MEKYYLSAQEVADAIERKMQKNYILELGKKTSVFMLFGME